jgi:uncharacterized protein YhbP (UPF0306 family)
MIPAELRERVAGYLKEHHTMTVATVSKEDGGPDAASVFYACDSSLRLLFLSKPSSAHGRNIAEKAPVAVTVAGECGDWELIQGVQLWGEASRLHGLASTQALGFYVTRFPFVSDILKQPKMAGLAKEIAVYRVTPERVAFTDNTTGVFGRAILSLGTQ